MGVPDIKIKEPSNGRRLNSLSVGEMFIYSDNVYLKLDNGGGINVFNFENSDTESMPLSTVVKDVKVSITVERI